MTNARGKRSVRSFSKEIKFSSYNNAIVKHISILYRVKYITREIYTYTDHEHVGFGPPNPTGILMQSNFLIRINNQAHVISVTNNNEVRIIRRLI